MRPRSGRLSFLAPIFLPLVLALFLALAVPLSAPAKGDPNGYAGMRWGSSLSDLKASKRLTLTRENDGQGSALYALEGEPLRFGKATLTGITCSFAKERLVGVLLLFAGEKNFAAAKGEALSRYGEKAPITQGNDQIYSWVQANTSIVLSYNRKNQSGFLFLKPRKPLPPVKDTAKKPSSGQRGNTSPQPAINPPDLETALDRASQPPSQPGDMDTALDLAGPPVPGSAPIDPSLSPEVAALIAQDQELTRLCWETVGPQADAACQEMRRNIERLKNLGMCLQADTANQVNHEVTWVSCAQPDPGQAAAARQTKIDPEQLCGRIREMFAKAARMRDNGVPSASAADELVWDRSSQFPVITEEIIRETINLVYYHPDYSRYGDKENATQAYERCMNNQGPYTVPLY